MSPHPQVAAIARGIAEIGESVVGVSREYLEQFAGATAWSALSVLELGAEGEQLEDALAELEAQALAVAETIAELGDQAQRRALVAAVLGAVRLAAAVAAP